MKYKVFEYSKCSTCRNALKFLAQKKIAFEKVDIVENPPTVKELKKMLQQKNGNLKSLFNTSGELYREMKLTEKLPNLSENEALELLSKNGKLVKRPFLLGEKISLVGFKEEEWSKLK